MNARDARDVILALVVALFLVFMLLGCAGDAVPTIPPPDAVAELNVALAERCRFAGVELKC